MAGKSILVLGGGIGGLVAANELRRLLPSRHRVVLVEKNPVHAFAPSFLWVMTGERKPAQIVRNLKELVWPGVEIKQADVLRLDTKAQKVETTHQILEYDYLTIALGAELAPESVPGLSEASQTFYTLDGAARLHEALEQFSGGIVAVLVSALPFKCPAAPYEAAMLIDDFFRRRGLRERVQIHLFTPESQPMPVAGPALGQGVTQMLLSKTIEFHPLHKVRSVDPRNLEISFDGNGCFRCDLLIAIPPHRAPAVMRETGLANEAGWVPVDRATLVTRRKNVYAIGDVNAISIPGRWKPDVPLPLPKAGVFAHAQAEVVARRISAEITGTATSEIFCGDGYCMLEAGASLAGFAFGNFFAEPSPQVQIRQIGRPWHWGKVLFEKWWLAPPGVRRSVLGAMIKLGGKAYGIPVVV